MKRELMEAQQQQVRDGRAALAVLLALSLLANLGLSIALASVERMTVLVPAVAGPAWEVGGGRAGSRYLEDMGRTIAVTLLTLTPENAEHAREAAARLAHASARGAIGAWVAPRPVAWRAATSRRPSTPVVSRRTPERSPSW